MVTATAEMPFSGRTFVLPRRILPAGRVNSWPGDRALERYERSGQWLSREEAERSRTWVQPIPTVVLHDGNERYCVAQRRTDAGPLLGGRLSIAFGGHIEEPPGGSETLDELLVATARRELYEETGVTARSALEPLALIRDPSSLQASRHIGFIYRASIDPGEVQILAPEEYEPVARGKASFRTLRELQALRRQLDPWSRLLLERIAGAG